MNSTPKPELHLCLRRFEFRIVLACLLAFVWTVAVSVEAQGQDHAGDKQALVALYNATDGENWAYNENWLSEEPISTWYGVTVNDGRVTELALDSNQLTGTIPTELGNLTDLQGLYLDFNQLTGTIPPELGNLSSLTGLYLADNQLTGSIPAELGNLTSLIELTLDDNQLTGSIPAELGNLTSLKGLLLSINQLTGTIPAELGNLSSLTGLYLADNQLTGTIPQSFTNLTLESFDFNGNPSLCAQADAAIQTWLSGIGEVRGPNCSPSGMSSADREALEALYNATDGENWANNENWLSEEPLDDWFGIVVSNGRVTELELSFNQLTGTIPTELSNLSSLTLLYLHGNRLAGPIPAELGDLTSLLYLSLSGNQLTGTIPQSFTNLTLEFFDFNGNPSLCAQADAAIQTWLSGIGEVQGPNCSPSGMSSADREALEALYNATDGENWANNENWLSEEPLDDWFGVTVSDGRVTGLDFEGNQLTGPIPAELGNLSSLGKLNLDDNQLTGSIPPELGNLSSLTGLFLRNNQLTGTIPAELGNLSSLTALGLSNNQLTGTLPPELGNLSSLTELHLPDNQLTGTIPQSFTNLTLELFYFNGNSGLCAQADAAIQTWLSGIGEVQGPNCSPSGMSSADREALVALYNATGGENWANNENWLSDEPLSTWSGVTVSDGRVTELLLGGNQLTGSIPPELGNLTNLTELLLNANQLTGPIPSELGNLASLTVLNFNTNQLTGPIPSELGNLASLRGLDLSNNQLTGSIPPELGTLSSLQWLFLANNQLTGTIPAELGNLSSLTELDLSRNQLTGSIPTELGNLASLTRLRLGDNRQWNFETRTYEGGLTGSIPTELGKLSNLTVLDLRSNQLTGPIPTELGDLSSLTELNLSSNKQYLFETRTYEGGLTGAIPPELGNLSSLRWLNLGGNQLTGAIPPELGNLSSLTQLYLSGNQLTGAIPAELGNLSRVTGLDLSGNQLTGTIPAWLGSLSSLTQLYLSGNQLTGAIPAELGDLSSLQWLSLGGNQLTGTIPAWLGSLSSLRLLSLSSNPLTGTIPPELGALANLQRLFLGGNQLTGTIPAELGELSSLQWLVLSSNQLTGAIPPELGALASLRWLYLPDNQLTGAIPAELGDLTSLQLLWLHNNQLTGAIPAELGNLASLTGLDLRNNQLTGAVPPELGELSSLWSLSLASNQLTGTIPPELGELSSLRSLYLSDNQLTGPIPPWLGSLSSLQALSLANNQLTGAIPSELGNLSSLVALNLSGNKLTGAIPQSFTTLMLQHFYFHGNPGLSVPDDVALREWLGGIKDVRDQDYSPATPFVPVILSSAGQNNSFYTSELTLTNRGTVPARLTYTYTAQRGGGSGVANDFLGPGEQRIIPNAIEFLRTRFVPIPGTGNRIGTLRVTLAEFSSSQVGVTVRTTTAVPEGRAGLAYPGVSAEGGFDEAVYLCGLRQNDQDRSNVAFQNMGTEEEGAITLRTTVYSGEPEDARAHVLEDRTLQPGGFYQYSGLLGVLNSVGGNRQGYVKVERVEGTAPFYAYGVINDQANSDGSFVFPVAASTLEGKTGQTLPVIVETGVFTSELMMTNFSESPKTVTFRFRAEAIQTSDKTARVEWSFQPGQQVIVPDVVDMLRKLGVAGIGRSGQTFAGALFATVAEGDMSGIVIGARTGSSDGRGGQYGVFYNALPYGDGFPENAWVEALQQNEENRSNLALVNTGEADDSPSVFQLDIYDGATGMLANTVTGLRVEAGGWRQINGILGDYAPGTTQGYVRILKISGNNPFLAYGVVNDGGAPGQRSGDGAYLPARE